MKFLPWWVLACLLSGCSNSPRPVSPATPATLRKDANPLRKEAANPYGQLDISPMDMLYFPADYPLRKMNGNAPATPAVRVVYSRPHLGGRKLFGHLVKWGEPWRLGANEATEIEFFQPVTIQNKRVEKGRYVLYAIPHPDRWTVVLNSAVFSWGLKFNPANDVARFDLPVKPAPQTIEHFTMSFERTAAGADLLMAWENAAVRLPIQL